MYCCRQPQTCFVVSSRTIRRTAIPARLTGMSSGRLSGCSLAQRVARAGRRATVTVLSASPRTELSVQPQEGFDLPVQQVLSALQLAIWLCATALQASALVLSYRQHQQQEHQHLQQQLALQEQYEQIEQAPAPLQTWSEHFATSPSLVTQAAVCAILIAAMIGRLRQWLSHGR